MTPPLFSPARRDLGRGLLGGAVSLLAMSLAGCGSPGRAGPQAVWVETPGCAARCELSNDRGRWLVPSTPGEVTVSTSHQPLAVRCEATGGALGHAGVPSTVAPPGSGGAVAGGAAGGVVTGAAIGAPALAFIPPLGALAVLGGAAAGAVAGRALEADRQPIRYPERITVAMRCGPAPTPPAPGPRFGLEVQGVPDDLARAATLPAPTGAWVVQITADSAADGAGLRAGDIVLAVDGREVLDAAELEALLRRVPPGANATLTVWRDGQRLSLRITRPSGSP